MEKQDTSLTLHSYHAVKKNIYLPDYLKIYLEKSTGNHNEEFLNSWHEKLQ